ncbi:MAG: hypothetical protein ACJ8G3_05625 [Burkholderiaceae bacterium]
MMEELSDPASASLYPAKNVEIGEWWRFEGLKRHGPNWNPIEHRLFSHSSMNRAGIPM